MTMANDLGTSSFLPAVRDSLRLTEGVKFNLVTEGHLGMTSPHAGDTMPTCSCGTRRAWFILYSYPIPFRGRTRVFTCDACQENTHLEVQTHLGPLYPREETEPAPVRWATTLLFPKLDAPDTEIVAGQAP